MSIKDIITLAFINIKSTKFKSLIYTFIILFFFILITCIFTGAKAIESFSSRYLNSDFHYKLIAVDVQNKSREEIIKSISDENIKNISKIFANNYDLFKIINVERPSELEGTIEVYGNYNGIDYTIDSGRDINNEHEMICSSKFYSGNFSDLTDTSMLVNLKEKVGQKVYTKYDKIFYEKDGNPSIKESFEREFTLVGTFDLEEDLTGYNVCYINSGELEDVIFESKTEFENKMEEQILYSNLEVLVLVDKYENMNNVLNKLEKTGYEARPYYKMDMELLVVLQKIVKYITITICIGSAIILYLFLKNTIKENSINIKLYKLIGYTNSVTRNVYIIHYIILTSISYVIHILLLPGIKLLFKRILSVSPDLMLLKLDIKYCESFFYLIFMIIMIVVIFSVRFYFKRNKNILLGEK